MWWFAVAEGRHAVSLSVFSGKYPESVMVSGPGKPSTVPSVGSWVTHHSDPEGIECAHVEGGRCTGDIGFHAAAYFWKEFGVAELGTEQPETFWKALEAALRKEIGS